MVQYSLSPQEQEIKRGLRRIQREIKQGIFIEIPIDIESIFDDEFHIKLSNCQTVEGHGDSLMINGQIVQLKEADVTRFEYQDGNMLFYMNNTEIKEMLEKFSISLAEDLRAILLAILPTSVRKIPAKEYIEKQYLFF
ncbi:MAG: hypothetical protein ACXAE3_02265 [Candidatus Kariarchaeaceae archaeon]|jgi:hypothetical protein